MKELALRWAQAVDSAYDGNAEALCDYLRCFNLPLTLTHRSQLAKLIDRKITPKAGRGRKSGKRPALRELMSEIETSTAPRAATPARERHQSKNNRPWRLAMYDLWPEALYNAWRNEPNDLCNYLLANDLALYLPLKNQLADLINNKIPRKNGPGPKPGPSASPDRFLGKILTEHVVARAKSILRNVRERHDGRAPRGAVPQALEDALRSFIKDGYQFPRDFRYSKDRALIDLRRGRRSRR